MGLKQIDECCADATRIALTHGLTPKHLLS